jgi:hypothetical protein
MNRPLASWVNILMASSKTPFPSNRSQFIVQENRDVMVQNGRFYIMEYEIAVLSVKKLAKAVTDWNL